MTVGLDHVAIVGYFCLFVVSCLQVQWTLQNPVDLFCNVLLLIGLGCLINYHVGIVNGQGDEFASDTQRKLRLTAHACLSGFLLLTVLKWSNSNFRYYDSFALAAHVFLFIAVFIRINQTAGAAGLAIYFILTIVHNGTKGGIEWIQLAGRILMAAFFGITTIKALAPALKQVDEEKTK
jgi:hypothetical protein